MKKFALFYNELSGRSFKRNKIEGIRQLLLNYGSVQEFSIKDPREVSALAVDFQEDFDLIVVAGGDGTANGLINELAYAERPFLFLPLGSGNDISASCKHNVRLSRIEKAIKRWNFKDVDLIEIESDKKVLCFTVACIGTDAMVSKTASTMPRWVAGQRYVLATFGEIFRNKNIAVKIKFDDFDYAGPVSVASLANTNRYGGGIALSPKSNIEDKQFRICVR
jgi:diacylglycerol kinase (ATP)